MTSARIRFSCAPLLQPFESLSRVSFSPIRHAAYFACFCLFAPKSIDLAETCSALWYRQLKMRPHTFDVRVPGMGCAPISQLLFPHLAAASRQHRIRNPYAELSLMTLFENPHDGRSFRNHSQCNHYYEGGHYCHREGEVGVPG
jgi:hypothetical protein